MLDVETMDQGPHVWPVTIGIVLATGRRYAMLIAPSADAAGAGGARASVTRRPRCGRAPREAALILNQLLSGYSVYTDDVPRAERALAALYDAVGLTPTFALAPIESILSPAQRALWPEVERRVVAELLPRRERAAHDARILQETWYRTRCATAA